MLTDKDSKPNRAKAIMLIQKIRNTPSAPVKRRGKQRVVRRFEKPHINMQATSFTELVNLDEIQLYEPPVTVGLEMESLALCLDNWDALKLPDLSSNNIPLERLIRVSSEVVSQMKTQVSRDFRILIRLNHTQEREETLVKPRP